MRLLNFRIFLIAFFFRNLLLNKGTFVFELLLVHYVSIAPYIDIWSLVWIHEGIVPFR